MSDRLGFGMIGCGEIAVHTSKAVLESQGCRVVHCMDTAGDLAGDLAAKHDARSTDDLETLLADDDVKAVVISTPHYLHAPLSIRAAEAGKHVLVEKPIACTLAQADEMIGAAEAAGVKLGVLLPSRLGFGPEKARELLAAGALGKVLAVKFHAMARKPDHYWHGGYTGRNKNDWRISLEKSGGGYLIMNMVHDIDTLVSIIDPRPQRIYAEYATFLTEAEVEDYLTFVMRLEDGAIWSLDGSSAAAGGESHGDRIYGEKGQIALGGPDCRVHLTEAHDDIKADEWVSLPQPEGRPGSRTLMVDGFADAVRSGGEVPVPGAEGRRSLEIIRGAYLSMKAGGPLEFPIKE